MIFTLAKHRAAIVLNSAYRPFLGLTLQGGRPGLFTIIMGSLVILNLILNYALIPVLEINGAALATGIVYLAEAVLVAIVARRVFGIKL